MNKSVTICYSCCASPPFVKQQKLPGYFSFLIHEIRNPLCNINLAYDMLNLTNLDADQRKLLDFIIRGSDRINDLVSTLLKTEGPGEEKYKFYSLRQLLEDVLVSVKERLLLKQVLVSREYTDTEDRMFLDVGQIEIALTNLLINSIEAMPPERGELLLVTRDKDDTSVIEIQDNGRGIDKGYIKTIFEPFVPSKPRASGLGLSTTLDILQANHVSLDIRSGEGTGTCFILSFEKG